jgi:membrane protein DedA with SNARE-associated domain
LGKSLAARWPAGTRVSADDLPLWVAAAAFEAISVIAAGGSGLSARQALPAQIIGSSAFLHLHLFLGYFLGSAARHFLRVATGPAIAVLAALAGGDRVLAAAQARRLRQRTG